MNKPVGPADVIDFGGLHLVADHAKAVIMRHSSHLTKSKCFPDF